MRWHRGELELTLPLRSATLSEVARARAALLGLSVQAACGCGGMYIEPVERQMAVCSFEAATRLSNADKRYWNVVSICGPRDRKADLRQAKSIHYACFDDVEDSCSSIYRSPRAEDIAEIFGFIRKLDAGPPAAPLLIHCQQGISRSTAVALSWIYAELPPGRDRLAVAIDLLLQLQPVAKPNRLVLGLGLAQFMPADEAHDLALRAVAEPRLARNRFQAPPAPLP